MTGYGAVAVRHFVDVSINGIRFSTECNSASDAIDVAARTAFALGVKP